MEERAAALLHSLATTSPLVRGNRAVAWVATAVYLARSGWPSPMADDEAVELVTDVLVGRVESVETIAGRLRGAPS